MGLVCLLCVQVIHDLPRLDYNLNRVSADLGSFSNTWRRLAKACLQHDPHARESRVPANRTDDACLRTFTGVFDTLLGWALNSSTSTAVGWPFEGAAAEVVGDDIEQYFESVKLWMIVAWVVALTVVATTVLIIVGRICCRCEWEACNHGAGACGGGRSTPRRSILGECSPEWLRWCVAGYRDAELEEDDRDPLDSVIGERDDSVPVLSDFGSSLGSITSRSSNSRVRRSRVDDLDCATWSCFKLQRCCRRRRKRRPRASVRRGRDDDSSSGVELTRHATAELGKPLGELKEEALHTMADDKAAGGDSSAGDNHEPHETPSALAPSGEEMYDGSAAATHEEDEPEHCDATAPGGDTEGATSPEAGPGDSVVVEPAGISVMLEATDTEADAGQQQDAAAKGAAAPRDVDGLQAAVDQGDAEHTSHMTPVTVGDSENSSSRLKLASNRTIEGKSRLKEYPMREVCCARTCLLAHALLVFIFVSTGQFAGNEGVNSAIRTTTLAPQGFVDMVTATADPFNEFVRNVASDTVRGALIESAEIFASGTDLHRVVPDMRCVLQTVHAIPDPDVAISTVLALHNAFVVTQDAAVVVRGALSTFIVESEVLLDALYDVDDTIAFASERLSLAAEASSNASIAASRASELVSQLNDADVGLPAIASDVDALNEMPSKDEIDAATGLPPTLAPSSLWTLRLIDEPVSVLVAKLAAIEAKIAPMPNYDRTADNMERFNALLESMEQERVFERLSSSINAATDALEDIKGTTAAVQDSYTVATDASLTMLTATRHAINSVFNVIDTIIAVDLEPAVQERQKLNYLPTALNCFSTLTKEFLGINETVMELPERVHEVSAMAVDINATLVPLLARLDELFVEAGQFQSFLADGSIQTQLSETIDQLSTAEQLVLGMDMADTFESMQLAEDSAQFDAATASLALLDAVSEVLIGFRIDDDIISAMRAFQSLKTQLLSDLALMQSRLVVYQGGYCFGTTKWCARNADCGGNILCLNRQVKRCLGSPAVLCPDATEQACNAAGSQGGLCAIRATEIDRLTAKLVLARSPPAGDELSTALDGAAVAVDNLDRAATATADAAATASSALQSAASAVEHLSDTVSRTVVSLETATVSSRQAINTGLEIAEIIAGIHFAPPMAALTSFKAAVQSVHARLPTAEQVFDLVEGLRDFSAVVMPGLLERLELSLLDGTSGEAGLGALLLVVASATDDAARFLNSSFTLFGGFSTDISFAVGGAAGIMDVVTLPDFRTHGALHFVASLLNRSSVIQPRRIVDNAPLKASRRVIAEAADAFAPTLQQLRDSGIIISDRALEALNPNTTVLSTTRVARLDLRMMGTSYPGRLLRNSRGKWYDKAGRPCLMQSCIDLELASIAEEPFSETLVQNRVMQDTEELESTLQWLLSHSAGELLGLPFLLPFGTMLVGLAAALCSFAADATGDMKLLRVSGSISSTLSRVSFGLTALGAALIFVGVGAVLWPLLIMSGDICYGTENVIYRLLEASHAQNETGAGAQPPNRTLSSGAICGGLFGGNGTFDECYVELPAPLNDIVRIDMRSLVAGVLGGAACENEPLRELYAALADAAETGPSRTVDNFIRVTLEQRAGVKLRSGMRTVLGTAGASIGRHLSRLLERSSQGLSCEAVHDAFSLVKDAACCGLLNVWFLTLSAWYLIAWVFLLCGCPSSLLGIKRFRGPFRPRVSSWEKYCGANTRDAPRRSDAEVHATLRVPPVYASTEDDDAAGSVKNDGDGSDVEAIQLAPVHHDGDSGERRASSEPHVVSERHAASEQHAVSEPE